MASGSRDERLAALPPKDSWQSFSLQKLTGSKFSAVVNKILNGTYLLIGPRKKNERI